MKNFPTSFSHTSWIGSILGGCAIIFALPAGMAIQSLWPPLPTETSRAHTNIKPPGVELFTNQDSEREHDNPSNPNLSHHGEFGLLPEPQNITKRAILSATASSEQHRHPAEHAFDENSNTAWNEADPKDGTGQWLEAQLRPGTYVDSIAVGCGWSASTKRNEDLWELNNSFRKMEISWDGSSTVVECNRSVDRGVKKSVSVRATTRFLRVTALEVDRGRFNDLCLDDVLLFGNISEPTSPNNQQATPPSHTSVCDLQRDETCSTHLFVQMATVPNTTAYDYNFPMSQKILRSRPDYRGSRLIESRVGNQRILGALVLNRCVANKLVEDTNNALKANAQIVCKRVETTREILHIP